LDTKKAEGSNDLLTPCCCALAASKADDFLTSFFEADWCFFKSMFLLKSVATLGEDGDPDGVPGRLADSRDFHLRFLQYSSRNRFLSPLGCLLPTLRSLHRFLGIRRVDNIRSNLLRMSRSPLSCLSLCPSWLLNSSVWSMT